MSQITNQFLFTMPPLTIKGNDTVSAANPLDLTVAQVNAILPIFTSTLNGLTPFSGGGSSNFLRADGTWAIPAASTTSNVNTTQVSTNASFFPLFVASSTNSTQAIDLGTGLTFNPSTNVLTTTTFVGALTGTASGNTTISPQNHAVVLSSATSALSTAIPSATSGIPLISQGSSADPVFGTALIAGGGTGATTKTGAFDALSPMTTGGDLIYGGASGTGTRLANGSAGQVLTSAGTTLAPTWQTPAAGSVTSVAMTVPSFLSVSGSPITSSGTLAVTLSGTALPILNGGTGQTTASAAFNALSPITTIGDLIIGTGTNTASRLAIGTNTQVLTSNGTTASWQTPLTSKAPTVQKFTSGSGTYTLPTSPSPLYIRVIMCASGASGGGGGSTPTGGNAGNNSTFGTSLLSCTGGSAVPNGVTGPGGAGGGFSLGSAIGYGVIGGTGDSQQNAGATGAGQAGGIGGANPFGGAGAGSNGAVAGGAGVANSGAGGGGGGGTVGNVGAGGGAGGYLNALLTSPLSTYSYVVGASVAGGAAGTSGGAGGASGSGFIYVEEYYS